MCLANVTKEQKRKRSENMRISFYNESRQLQLRVWDRNVHYATRSSQYLCLTI